VLEAKRVLTIRHGLKKRIKKEMVKKRIKKGAERVSYGGGSNTTKKRNQTTARLGFI